MFCLDDLDEDLAVGGSYNSPYSKEISFLVYPCNVQSREIFEGLEKPVSEDCVADLEKQIKYLRQP